ncbi:MAG: T9SS type A sorting domain-containing protein [Ferruginibacter sp.]
MKFQLIIKSFLFATLLVFTGIANATDYYVSATGNDSNNGTSQSTPWKSISKVESFCNNGSIHAGDRILFKCGDQFTGKAVIAGIWGNDATSGTATNPITLGSYGTGAKPVFLYPTGGSTPAESRVLFWFAGVDYWVVDGLNFTDLDVTNNKVTPANCGIPLYLGSDVGCNHWTVQNVDISLCGMGIVLVGDYNIVQNCNMTNFKNLKSTPNTGGSSAYEDYGANPFTLLDGNYNTIRENYVTGGWAESLDFGFNGGFCEMFGSCSNNTFMYNTIIDCNGLSEFGANGATANSVNNLYAYNKLIDNGAMFYCNISGPFACQVGNVMFYNNTVVETNNSRFAQGSANAGAGVTSPEAISHLNVDSYMFLYNGSPTATTVYTLKNNIFNISNPLKICRSSESRLTHDYQVFKLSGGSTFALALNSHEVSTSAVVFNNTTASSATSWDLTLPTASPAIDRGTDVGIDSDFVGTPVPAVPNAGIYETVTGASTLAAASTATAISCNGGTSTVTVTATGGTAPYTGTGTFTVSAGSYTYTVTDAAGTTKTTSITVTQPTALGVVLSSGTIAVFGGTTTLTVSASGGTSGYTYKLNSGSYQSSNTFTSVAAGTHSVTVKDANGCTAIQTITITQPAQPAQLVAASSATAISCNGGTATVTVSATGGVTPYTGTGTFTVNAGTYTYTVTDAAGTTATTTVTVSQPTAISLSTSAGTIAVNGGTTSITATATGGTGAYTYKLNSGSYQASNTFSSVAAGTHTVTVKDANGCTKTSSITITQPAQLVASSTGTSISCNGGTSTVTVSATGGVTPYTGTGTFTVNAGTYNYTVTDANGATATTSVTISQPTAIALTLSSGTIAVFGGTTTLTASATGGTGAYTYKLNSGSYQASNTFSSVAAGTHSVTVKDANGCTKTSSITITQPAPPAQLIAASGAGTISCNGGTTTVTVSATGGVTPYTGTGTFTVSAGTYTYTVTDAAGTTATTSVTVTQPSVIGVTIAAGTIAVFGGTTSVQVNATGGTGAYTYKLNSGSYQSSNTFAAVAAGSHAVTVMDANGCTTVKSFTLTQPAQPVQLVASSTAGTISCNGGTTTVVVSATGGVSPYTGTGSFNVTAGTYSYTVTDANGTTATTAVTITQPSAISVTLAAGTIAVFGGTTSLTVTATGGTGAYTYQLDGGSFQSSNVFGTVAAGAHTVIVKDANGCTSSQSITITQPAQNTFVVTATATPITCNSQISTILVEASGGTAPYTGTGYYTGYAGTYTYTVTDANGASASTTITITQPTAIALTVTAAPLTRTGGTTTVVITATGGNSGVYSYQMNGGAFQSSNTFLNVGAGVYTINVKDANGCTAVYTLTIADPGAGSLKISLVAKSNATCRGSYTGSIKVQATGGRAPYTYRINGGRYSSSATFSSLKAGIYRVTAKDANGNTVSLVTYIYDGRTVCPGSGREAEGLTVTAYPNPSTDRFSLAIASGNESDVLVEVMNLYGTKVYEGKGSVSKNYVFGNNFPAGTYFVRVTQGKDVKTTTIIKGK